MPNQVSLDHCVRLSLNRYFETLDGEKPSNIYDMVLHTVEKPLFAYVLDKARGNQSEAARMLGINRNTLRKKLEQYQLA